MGVDTPFLLLLTMKLRLVAETKEALAGTWERLADCRKRCEELGRGLPGEPPETQRKAEIPPG
jgi:hypothetical protein